VGAGAVGEGAGDVAWGLGGEGGRGAFWYLCGWTLAVGKWGATRKRRPGCVSLKPA